MKILNLEGLTHYTTKLLDKVKTMLDEKADKNHVHDKSEQMYSYTIDLSDSTYDQDTYYPVVAEPLPTSGLTRIKLSVQLNSGTVPAWSTHANGFSCNLDLLATHSGWGTTNKNTIILDHSYSWATNSPNPCGYYQLHCSSRPVLWLRGGGKYFVWSEYDAVWDIKTSEYTLSEDTVAPTTTYPGIVLNKATIIADLQGDADTLDGYHGDNYAFAYSNYGANYFNSMDLNTWTRSGEYAIQSGCTNTPSERGDDVWGTIFVVKGLSDRISQYAVFWNETGNPLWHRCLNGSTWSTWLKVRDGGNAATANSATSASIANYSKYMAGWDDNRSVNTTPNDYNARFEVKGLKTNSAIGSPDGSAFSTVMGLRAWHDYTGGQTHELAFTGNGQMFQRYGSTDTWGSWNRLYTSDNITCGTSGLTAGSSTLASGNIYLQYE